LCNWRARREALDVPRSLARAAVLALVLLPSAAPAQPETPPRAPYEAAAEALARFVEHERTDKDIPAITVALVDDQRVVWARGFGQADPGAGDPADADTIVRVGSVSKLFTDLALMRLVEDGKIDLDAPITDYLPELTAENPFDRPITLRQVLAHRAGLVREPPVGHYFDPTEPSLEAAVASLGKTRLVYEPGTKTKYSNAGIALVGRVVERVAGRPFDEAVRALVLEPLGMDRSAFAMTDALRPDYAHAVMWTYDGRTFPAPTFELSGIAPAGNLYSDVNDLARFLSALFAGGQGARGRVVKAETLEQMLTPQEGGRAFGLGFALGELDGHKRAGHGGAVYGFATAVAFLPGEKLGVAVVASKDCANVVSERIADAALRLMLAAREGRPLPDPETTAPIPPERIDALVGLYRTGPGGFELVRSGDDLFYQPPYGGLRHRLRARGESLVVDDAYRFGMTLRPEGEGVALGEGAPAGRDTRFGDPPPPPPDRWLGLIGEYGWDHDVLYILEREGKLHALIEWFELYPLEETSEDEYAFPPSGLYAGESLRFERDADGRGTRAVLADAVVFERRPLVGEDGQTFRIEPAEPVEALRARALAAEPPEEEGDFREPELVDLEQLDPSIRLDVRYAGTNNFLGTPFYTRPRAYLQRPAAEALARVHRGLKDRGYGLLVHDAYRPWSVTKMFWDATRGPDRQFVADPSKGSKHNRGCAVDLSLYDLETGEPVRMVGGYDEFSPRSYPDYPGGTSRQRWLRDLLRRAMEAEGFTVNDYEWWHFDHDDWPHYPILNVPFEDL
jgi:CubicO group peptidase (beta-lactamase class C family)/D-alanyl-D-alanine dipeptidase